ncbi:MAG: hypothetical protein AB8B66_05115 [Rickettsiaceae bacterium]
MKTNSSDTNQQTIFELVQEQAPQLLDKRKENIGNVSKEDVDSLGSFIQSEDKAKELLAIGKEELPKLIPELVEQLNEGLEKSPLSDKDKEQVQQLFDTNVIQSIRDSANYIYKGVEGQKDALYTAMLSDRTANILGGIIKFKKAVDKQFPGKLDQLVDYAGKALVGLIATQSPAVGLLLAKLDVSTKLSKMLSTDNLEKTLATMRTELDKIKDDKQLGPLYEQATEVAQTKTSKVKIEGRATSLINDKTRSRINKIKECLKRPKSIKTTFVEKHLAKKTKLNKHDSGRGR